MHSLVSKDWLCSTPVFAYMSEQLLDSGLLKAVLCLTFLAFFFTRLKSDYDFFFMHILDDLVTEGE